ncbi:MAG: response regulator transcription factor [Vulcanimicrobiaceae bacterium]
MDQLRTASIEIARRNAQDALEQFDLVAVRIDARVSDGPIDTLASLGTDADQFRPIAGLVTSLTDAPPPPEMRGTYLGIPLISDGRSIGYLQCIARTTIGFTLAARVEQWSNSLAHAIASAQATLTLETSSNGRLLIADDDASIRKLLCTILEKDGFTVTAVANGLLAFETARRERPDLILLDFMMPILDGRETAMRLKADEATKDIPIVMVTGQTSIEDKVAALEAGAQDYVTKPFDPRELLARVHQQLRWRKLLSDDATPIAEKPTEPAPEAPIQMATNGDYWSLAVSAQQQGRLREALAYFVQEAETCEVAKQFARAAIAFRSASAVAGQLQKPDLSNKLLRLAGKMYLCWGETSDDGKAIQEAYVNAARSFLAAGNLQLAKKSVEFAASFDSVLADDRPTPIS